MLIHVLSSPVAHHNQTLLTFFDQQLSGAVSGKRSFWVVGSEMPASVYPHLDIAWYPSKRAIARAVVRQAVQSRDTRFFFHGLFNVFLWLAILTGRIRHSQSLWHIWGADLYEQGSGIKFRVFYLLRRLAQRRLGVVFGTLGDLSLFRQQHPTVTTQRLYFPTRMPVLSSLATTCPQNQPFTILLGNSGDTSNRHIEALKAIKKQFGHQASIIVPMGYPPDNQAYIDSVRQQADVLFARGRVTIISEQIDFTAYCQLLACCSLGYFNFDRQQGIGTLCLLIEAGIPFVISRENRFWQDLAEQQIPLLFNDEPLDGQRIAQAHQQLRERDKSTIAFMPGGYLADWQQLLQQIEGAGR